MNPELVLKFMSQDVPWSFGLRATLESEPAHILAKAPVSEVPFFAALGRPGHQFRVIADNLEECLEQCLSRSPFIQPVPDAQPTAFVNPPEPEG